MSRGHRRAIEKLRARVAPLIPPDEQLCGAFPAVVGPQLLDKNAVLPGPLGIIGQLIDGYRATKRTHIVVAVTDRSTLIFQRERTAWMRTELWLSSTHPPGSIKDVGDDWIVLRDAQCWVERLWIDEAKRLSLL
ncbi:MAG: hypothetical protein ABI658_00600 [Acidimicrobiales bacterium]